MTRTPAPWRLLPLAAAVLVAAGCVQSGGGDPFQGTDTGQGVAQLPTNVADGFPTPVFEDFTVEDATEDPFAADEPLIIDADGDGLPDQSTPIPFFDQTPIPPPPDDPFSTPFEGEPLTDGALVPTTDPFGEVFVPTITPDPFFLIPTPTDIVFVQPTEAPTPTLQPTADPFAGAAQIGTATADPFGQPFAEAATATPAAFFVTASPTATPTPFVQDSALVLPTLTPFEVAQAQPSSEELTATAIIFNATQQAQFALTATAAAGGIGVIDPIFPTQDLGGGVVDPLQPLPTDVPPVVPIAPGSNCIHEVRAQDRNLTRLALAYGVTVRDIAQASGIVNPDLIRIGQRLTIPGCGTTGARPPATSTPRPDVSGSPGQGGGSTGEPGFGFIGGVYDPTYGTSVIFPAGTPTPGAPIVNPNPGQGGGQVYVVRQGDNLFRISLAYGVPISSIAAANGITNVNFIQIGQQLVIPPA